MTRAVRTDRICTAIAWNVREAADTELFERNEVLMYRDKPIAKWTVLYVLPKPHGKMFGLDTNERSVDAAIEQMKPYYVGNKTKNQNRVNPLDNVSDKNSGG